jgi:hypothetical protein
MPDKVPSTTASKPARKPRHKVTPGRPKGSKNKIPRETADMVKRALELSGKILEDTNGDIHPSLYGQDGGVIYLAYQAVANPKAFMPLVAKLMPTKVDPEGIAEAMSLVDVLNTRRRVLAEMRSQVLEAIPEVLEIVDDD